MRIAPRSDVPFVYFVAHPANGQPKHYPAGHYSYHNAKTNLNGPTLNKKIDLCYKIHIDGRFLDQRNRTSAGFDD